MTASILQEHNSFAIVRKGDNGQSQCLNIQELSHPVQLNCRQGSDPSHCPCSNKTLKSGHCWKSILPPAQDKPILPSCIL